MNITIKKGLPMPICDIELQYRNIKIKKNVYAKSKERRSNWEPSTLEGWQILDKRISKVLIGINMKDASLEVCGST